MTSKINWQSSHQIINYYPPDGSTCPTSGHSGAANAKLQKDSEKIFGTICIPLHPPPPPKEFMHMRNIQDKHHTSRQ